MQIVCTAFQSVGHKSLGDDLSLVDCRDEKKKLHELIYDEIKTIIMDHQAVMKKYETFLTIFKGVLFLEIVVFSMTFLILCICCIMSFSNDDRFKSSRIFTINIFFIIIPNLFKLFGMCYLFGNIVEQRKIQLYSHFTAVIGPKWI